MMDWDAWISSEQAPKAEVKDELPPTPPPVLDEVLIEHEKRDSTLRKRAMDLIAQAGGFMLPMAKRRTDFTPEEEKLKPELIKGLLRKGHKMILSGASKSGKSFMMIELALCLANGSKWMGFDCKKCKVLYMNLEIDGASFLHRVDECCQKMKMDINDWNDNLKIMNMRGFYSTLREMKNALIGYMLNEEADTGVPFSAVIIDPIYKVTDGEENSAKDVGNFCMQVDYICKETEASVIFSHHHSKGDQGYKSAQDRASGSGVFARDPDCMVDMIVLELDKETYGAMKNKYICDYWIRQLDSKFEGWREDIDEPSLELSGNLASIYQSKSSMTSRSISYMTESVEQEFQESLRGKTPLRLEFTLREFGIPDPINVFFKYPVHLLDDTGILAGADPMSHIQGEKKERVKPVKKNRRVALYEDIVEIISMNGFATYEDLGVKYKISKRWMRKRIQDMQQEFDEFEIVEGGGNEPTKIYFKGEVPGSKNDNLTMEQT